MVYRNAVVPAMGEEADYRPLILAAVLAAAWFGLRALPKLKKHISPIGLILASAVLGVVVYSI